MTTEHLRRIVAQPLSPSAFAPFGSIVSAGLSAGNAANQGTAVRFDRCSELVSTRAGATPNLAVFRSTKKELPFVVRLVERHPCSTQTFLPMVCTRFLICACPPRADGTPDVDNLQAFVCGPGQGFTWSRGVWHHPIIAIDGDADFAMLAWEDGTALDCEEFPLVQPLFVVEQ